MGDAEAYLPVPAGGVSRMQGVGATVRRLSAWLVGAQPVVHCLAHPVSAWLVAAALKALGARPVMGDAPEEAAALAARADALAISLGVPSASRGEAAWAALAEAGRRGLPVVLDPVGVGASPLRDALYRRLQAAMPRLWALRLNLAEAEALLSRAPGEAPEGLRGVDAAGPWDPARAMRASARLAAATGAVVVVTGPRDAVVGGGRCVWVDHGHPLLAATVGTGCALAAVVAAFLAAGRAEGVPPVEAAVAAVAAYGVAGERAAAAAAGPGTLAPMLVDALYRLAHGDVPEPLRIEEVAAPWEPAG